MLNHKNYINSNRNQDIHSFNTTSNSNDNSDNNILKLANFDNGFSSSIVYIMIVKVIIIMIAVFIFTPIIQKQCF